LARGLAKLGVQVTALATNARQEGIVDVPRERVEEGVRIITEPVLFGGRVAWASRYGISPRLWLRIASHVGKADIVHLNGFWGAAPLAAAAACRVHGKPYVVSTRGNLQEDAIRDKRTKKAIALTLGNRRLIKGAGSIHYTTNLERRWSPEWAKNCRSFIAPNPMEIRPLANGTQLSRKYGIAEGAVLLGFFGRIHRRKGFDVLIPALADAVSKNKDLKLIVAGHDEGYGAELAGLVRRYEIEESVVMAGELRGDELDEAFSGVDILVLPAHGENFGNVVAEAAIQGTPCLVSDRLGLKDWVEESDAGLVLELDVVAWAEALSSLSRDEIARRWRPDRLARHARESFSIDTVARKMLEHYERIVLEHR
jgi:glycosyltransferase involved in cell wall biosynthesis